MWLIATGADSVALGILRRSLWSLLALPLLLAIPVAALALGLEVTLIGEVHPTAIYVASSVTFVVFEELIKLRASHAEQAGIRAFALVSLFGIFELALLQPILIWDSSFAFSSEMLWAQVLLIPAVCMHTLTAAIYAFWGRQARLAQFAVCAAIHLLFNFTADAVEPVSLGLWIALMVLLNVATWLLLPKNGAASRGRWSEKVGNSGTIE